MKQCLDLWEPQATAAAREMCDRALADPHYPRFHAAPPGGWMNDPHLIYFNGEYHVLYQYSYMPGAPYDGPHRWGHAVSRDLARWRHLPVAITPRDHGIAPHRHIWSGSLVDNDGVGTAIYTMENLDVWVATSHDPELRRFEKHAGNPVIKGPPPGLDVWRGGEGPEMRDPWVWREADGWYLAVGSGFNGGRGPVIPLYHSPDLVRWEYLHPLYEGDAKAGDGGFCECPCFFPLGDKHVLFLSHERQYLVGRYENHRFTPERRGSLDAGPIYVPHAIADGRGRRILWGWVHEERDRDAMARAGWACMQTLPRVLSLGDDGLLRFEPAEELGALRGRHCPRTPVPADGETALTGISGAQLELQLDGRLEGAGSAGIALRQGGAEARVTLDAATRQLRFRSVIERAAPLPPDAENRYSLRLFYDGSVVEAFVNRRQCATFRVYPEQPAAVQAYAFAQGAGAEVAAEAWKLEVP